MKFEHDGITLWLETSDAPVPSSIEPLDRDLTITMAVQPIDASNHVELRYRLNGQNPENILTAEWSWSDVFQNVQYFRATLPPFQSGDYVEYTATCHCAGRRVPASSPAQYQGLFRIESPPKRAGAVAPDLVTPSAENSTHPANGEMNPTDQTLSKAAHLAAHHQMIEDYHLTSTPLIADDLHERFAIIERHEADRTLSEFITVSNDEQYLLYFHWEPNSDSGWCHESIAFNQLDGNSPADYQIERLWAYWEQGKIFVFCSDGQQTIYAYQRDETNTWRTFNAFENSREPAATTRSNTLRFGWSVSQPITTPYKLQSFAGPALTEYNGSLYMAYNTLPTPKLYPLIYAASTKDFSHFGLDSAATYAVSSNSPSICSFNDELFMAYSDPSAYNNLSISHSNNGHDWSNCYIERQQSPNGPSLVSMNNRLYLAYRANDRSDHIWVTSSTNGTTWKDTHYLDNQRSTQGPALAVFDEKLYMAYISDALYLTSSVDGACWSQAIPISQQKPSDLVLSSFNGRLYLIYRNDDSSLHEMSSSDGIHWYEEGSMQGPAASGKPGLSVFNDVLSLAYTSHNDVFTKYKQLPHLDLYRDLNGHHYIMYRDPKSQALVISTLNSSGNWETYSSIAPEESVGAVFRIVGGDLNKGLNIFQRQCDVDRLLYRQAQLINGNIIWKTPKWQVLEVKEGITDINSINRIELKEGRNDYLSLDPDGALYYTGQWDSCTPVSIRLTGGVNEPQAVAQYTIGADDQGNYRIFILDRESQNLWVRRQRGFDQNGGILFDDWVQLGGQYRLIESPAYMTDFGELFAITFDPDIIHKRQDDGNNVWRETPIKIPIHTSEEPQPVTTYATELNFSNKANMPAANSLIDIYVSRAVDITINGLTHHTSAHCPITMPTDQMGRLTLSTVADKLTTASLLVHARDFMAEGEAIALNPALSTHHRLSGQDPNFPITGTALRSQGLIASEFSDEDANTIATAIKHAAAMIVPTQVPPNADKLQRWLAPGQPLENYAYVANLQEGYEHPTHNSQSWELDFSDPTAIQFRLFEARAEDLLSLFSLKNLWGDVSHFVKHVVKAVDKIVVHVVGDVTHLVLTLANETGKFIIDTAEKAGEVLGVIFHKIAEKGKDFIHVIKEVLNWIRQLFSWQDIIQTERVIYHYLDQGFANLADSMDEWKTILNNEFDHIKKDITSAFDDLEKVFPNGVTFNEFVGGSQVRSSATTASPLAWSGMQHAYASHAIQCNYVQTRIQRHFSRGDNASQLFSFSNTVENDIHTLLDSFKDQFPLNTLESSYEKITDWSKEISGLSTFFEVAIRSFIEISKDFVLFALSGIEAVLDTLLDICSRAINAFRQSLTSEIDIPVISWLFKDLTGEPMSLLHLFSLSLAAPVTILYKLVYGHGKEAPFTRQQADVIVSGPIPWLNAQAASPLSRFATVERTAVGDFSNPVSNALGFIAGMTTFVYWPVDTNMDISNINGVSPVERQVAGVMLIIESAAQFFGGPFSAIGKSPSNRSAADKWAIGLWAGFFGPILSDLLALISSFQSFVRFVKAPLWLGAWWDGIMGAVLLGIAIKTAVVMKEDPDYNDWAAAYGILAAAPLLAKPVTMFANREKMAGPEGELAAAALMAAVGLLDLGDLGAAVTLVGGSVDSDRVI